jgi:hypothetical protein
MHMHALASDVLLHIIYVCSFQLCEAAERELYLSYVSIVHIVFYLPYAGVYI